MLSAARITTGITNVLSALGFIFIIRALMNDGTATLEIFDIIASIIAALLADILVAHINKNHPKE